LVAVGLVALAARAAAAAAARRLVWNTTPSVPCGLYRLRAGVRPAVGRTVVFPVPLRARELVAERHYLAAGDRLMKRVVAGPGEFVCLAGDEYRVNGRLIAHIRARDSQGRPLPVFRFCDTVARGYAFLATSAPLSFDSRYFGPVRLDTLTVVTPLWTFSR
jgi:conjugative transfer signal peptidase TraF